MTKSLPAEVREQRFVLSDQALEELARRLAWTRLPTGQGMGWEQGVPTDWLHGLLGDWQEFDAGALQRQLDGLRQFRAEVKRQGLHVVVAEGRGPDPIRCCSRMVGRDRYLSTSRCCHYCVTRALTAPTQRTRSRRSSHRYPASGSAAQRRRAASPDGRWERSGTH